jgi:hypothetical protein
MTGVSLIVHPHDFPRRRLVVRRAEAVMSQVLTPEPSLPSFR